MWDFLKNWFLKKPAEKIPFPGAILDDESLKGAIKFEEIVAKANPVVWRELDINRLPNWPVLNQDGSSGCVAFSLALMAHILYYIRTEVSVIFSPGWIYRNRENYPGEGMVSTNAFKIAANPGLVPEEILPSQNLSEAQMNSLVRQPWHKTVAGAFAFSDELIILPMKNMELVASVIQTTGKPVMIWFEFAPGEWTNQPIWSGFDPIYRHSTVAIPPQKVTENTIGIYRGEKCIVLQDSWSIASGISGKRIITESYFKKRNIFAAYPMRFKFDYSADKPVFDGSIISLQKCLQSIGLFPTNVSFVENIGPVTKDAIKKFQRSVGLIEDGTLNEATLQAINKKF